MARPEGRGQPFLPHSQNPALVSQSALSASENLQSSGKSV